MPSFLSSFLFVFHFSFSFSKHSLALSLSLQLIRWYTKCIQLFSLTVTRSYWLTCSQSGASLSSFLPSFLPSFCCLFFSWPHSRSRSRALRLCGYSPRIFGFGFGFGFSGPGRLFFPFLFFAFAFALHRIGVFVFFPFPHVARLCSRCTLVFFSSFFSPLLVRKRERETESCCDGMCVLLY